MFIGREDAQHIVDEMKTSIHRDINIMDGEGVILASTNATRRRCPSSATSSSG